MDDPILSMTLSCNSDSSSDAAEQDSPQESEEMAAVEEEPSEVEARSLVLDVLGVPTVIKHYPVPATKKSPYWRFYRVLKVPLTHHGKNRNTPSTHLCILCLKCLMEKANTSPTAWKTAACRVQTAANAHHHLIKKHQRSS